MAEHPTCPARLLCIRDGGSGSSRVRQPAKAAAGSSCCAQPEVEFSNDAGHLQQIQQLEKRLFAKSDGWRGELFEEQLKKRNTYCLYVLCEPQRHLTNPGLPSKQLPAPGPDQPYPQQQDQQQQQPTGSSSGVVQGYIVVQVNSVTAHINKLAVAPEAQRTGLATRLLKAVLQLVLVERRVLCATLHVDVSNAAALGLYRKAGFQEDGLIEDYYGHGRHAHKLIVDLQESAAMQAFLAA